MSTSNFTTDAQGGVLVPEELVELVIKPMLDASQLLASLPEKNKRGIVGELTIPMVSPATAGTYFLGEGETIPAADVSFDEVKLLQRGLKSLKMVHPVSGELIRNAGDDALEAVGEAISIRAASVLETELLTGPGTTDSTGTRIKGLYNLAGVQKLTAPGGLFPVGAPTLDQITDAITESQVAGANPTRMLAHPRVIGRLNKLRELTAADGNGEGQYLVQTSATESGVPRLRGLTPIASRNVPYDSATGLTRVTVYDPEQIVAAYEKKAPSLQTGLGPGGMQEDEEWVRFISRWDINSTNAPGIVHYDVDLAS